MLQYTKVAAIFRLTSFIAVMVVGSIALAQSASLSMTLAVDPTFDVDINGNQTYTATITNSGSGDANNLSVTFTLPGDDIPISATPGSCSFVPGSQLTVICALGTLPAGGTTTAVVVAHPTVVGEKDASAAASESGGSSANASTSSQIIEVGISDVQITLTDSPDPAQVGKNLTYTATALNLGDDSAANVSITVTPPSGVRLVSASNGCRRAGSVVICAVGSIGPGQSASISLTVKPQLSGWMYASAGVQLSTPDPSFTNNSAAARTWVNP
ncbi:MAG TPA: DUF11 domain-containing protein [Terriglobales bacterium]|jgi:uncharacterized repeat protein (TIGR01451 family)